MCIIYASAARPIQPEMTVTCVLYQRYLAHYKNIIASTSSTNVNGGGMAAVTSGSSVADAAVEKDAGGGGGSGGGGGTVAAEEEGVHYQARSNLMYIQHTIGEGDGTRQ